MVGCQSMNKWSDGVQWTSQQVSGFSSRFAQNVALLSLAESEGPSDFTTDDPLLLMSSPCNRPTGSFCRSSEILWEFDCCRWWADMLAWEWLKGNCMFWWPECPPCCGRGKYPAELYDIWCIPKLNDSEGLIISPVAILSLSTSFLSASFRAV